MHDKFDIGIAAQYTQGHIENYRGKGKDLFKPFILG